MDGPEWQRCPDDNQRRIVVRPAWKNGWECCAAESSFPVLPSRDGAVDSGNPIAENAECLYILFWFALSAMFYVTERIRHAENGQELGRIAGVHEGA